jgi:ABC-type multidrug transport system fused ATPase/permease subunit
LFFYQQTKIDATSDDGDKPQTVTGDIEFDNITFTYPARQEAPVCFQIFFSAFYDQY